MARDDEEETEEEVHVGEEKNLFGSFACVQEHSLSSDVLWCALESPEVSVRMAPHVQRRNVCSKSRSWPMKLKLGEMLGLQRLT